MTVDVDEAGVVLPVCVLSASSLAVDRCVEVGRSTHTCVVDDVIPNSTSSFYSIIVSPMIH